MTQINGDTDLKLCEKFPLLINKKAYLLGESLLKNNLIYNEFLEKKKRESFLNFNIIKLSYISKTHDIIDPYSSSDEEIEDGIKFKTHPGVKDVCEVIVDVNTLMIIVKLKIVFLFFILNSFCEALTGIFQFECKMLFFLKSEF